MVFIVYQIIWSSFFLNYYCYHGLSWFSWLIMAYHGISWFITVYVLLIHGLSWALRVCKCLSWLMIFFMPYHGFSQCLWGFPLLIMMGNGCKIGKVCGDEAGAEASLQAGSRQALTPSRQQKKILFGM
jgi:hypothetical protein